jgi:23S rRNA (pseudouridine1915-N3)-methyltransferase
MRITIIAVGTKQPSWVEEAVKDYLSRFPSDWKVELKAVKAEDRTTGKPIAKVMELEAERIRAALPKDAFLIILDERGKDLTSVQMAQKIAAWGAEGLSPAFVIGGADGIDPGLKAEARFMLRLSSLTMPHGLVRVLIAEQLYRAWSLLNHHPYHRA